eukprot:58671-Pleurochrysis_carterae.AAC.6
MRRQNDAPAAGTRGSSVCGEDRRDQLQFHELDLVVLVACACRDVHHYYAVRVRAKAVGGDRCAVGGIRTALAPSTTRIAVKWARGM